MIRDILVLGAGSAGLLAALSLKRKIPQLDVRVVRSVEVGVIGVGESTTPNVPRHLFEYLGLDRAIFYEKAQPTWKMGIHFLWGPRKCFEYGFELQFDVHWSDLPVANGFYCQDEYDALTLNGALMAQGKAFARQAATGAPDIPEWAAFHIDNPRFVAYLEVGARQLGVEIIDGKLSGTERGEGGITALVLEDGRRLGADFFVDASGFRSELLGKALGEPFVSFARTLFCDRAIVGSWPRTSDPVHPYTTAETMDAGWCWRIEHPESINRGYVYSSAFISDEAAREEFLRKNPLATAWDRPVKFRSGRHQRLWAENVVAIGNAGGFVEPLESSALMMVCAQCQTLVQFLEYSHGAPTPTMRDLYTKITESTWEEIRDFLALHYRYNTLLDTPFWRQCRAEVDLAGAAEIVNFYQENGPTGLCRHCLRNTLGTGNQFGIDGFLVMLVGNKVPYRQVYRPAEWEWNVWNQRRAQFRAQASNGVTADEALKWIKQPAWNWYTKRAPTTPELARA